ncbi:SusC/RagA family TonB-linked outer membrane protein [Paraflavitalea pollutisoli]|uniref:SusC/RagA family TonB-linked outer membrane protein n=1 Tax=Paraflavitalea pollutisoli TaxID=3034143 RepID=UPI0023EDD9BA|nr:TonB-dependent receptor [Paraflavitalea sp. H1-2-19X]
MTKTIACALLLLCLLVSPAIWAQQQQVTGKVNDQDGKPIAGASITVKGTTRGTVTDPNGSFIISASNGETLIIKSLGYGEREFAVGSVPAAIALQPRAADLDDIVVIGYGTQKKSVTTGAISRVKGSDLENMPINRVEDALQGRASGITIAANSGQPGSAATVRVRGITTLNNNNPLWVIDGVVVDAGGIGYLNQSDIESIEVLKDAASQAIYGSRAATGVILVTTKKGKAGRVSVNYNGFYGTSAPAKKLDLLNATDYATLRNEAAVNAGKPAPFANPSSLGAGTDWQDVIFNKDARRQNHELSISGGSDKSTFYMSLGYLDQEGIVASDISKYQRIAVRINSTHKINSWLSLGENIGYAHDKSVGLGNTNSEFGGPLSAAINLDPITPLVETDPVKAAAAPYTNKGVRRDANGNPYGISTIVGQEMTNPLAYIQTRLGNYSWSDNVVGNMYAEVSPLKGLKIKSTFGLKLAFWGDEAYTPVFWLNATNSTTQTNFRRTNNRRFDYNLENTISYARAFGDHNFTVLAGQGAYLENRARMTSVTFFNIPADNFDEASLNFKVPADQRNTDGSEGIEHMVSSLFGRITYDYQEKYLFQALVRRDGSSRFGPNKQYGVFPSFMLGWVASKENFFPANSRINFLKFRAGYGAVGNDNIGDFAFISTVGSGRNYTIGTSGSYSPGYSPNAPSNPNLKWEETRTTNIGFDAVLLDDINVTVEWFNKKTVDILQNPRIPGYVGAIGNPAANIGSVKNTGFEVELGYRKKMGDFSFSANGNISWMKNEVTFLGNGIKYLTGGANFQNMNFGGITRTQVGQPIGEFFGLKTLGIFQNQAEVDAHTDKTGKKIQPDAKPGDFRWQDTDGNGAIDEADRVFIGNPTPTWTYGMTFNLAYKGFDAVIFGQGAFGNKIFQGLRRLDIGNANWQTRALGRWTGEGATNVYPRLNQDDPNKNFNNPSDFYLEDGGYFRLKTLQVGYTLPAGMISKAGLNRVRVYVMSQNLFTITQYTGYDPEIGGGVMSIDRGIYPQARSFMLGINVGL